MRFLKTQKELTGRKEKLYKLAVYLMRTGEPAMRLNPMQMERLAGAEEFAAGKEL